MPSNSFLRTISLIRGIELSNPSISHDFTNLKLLNKSMNELKLYVSVAFTWNTTNPSGFSVRVISEAKSDGRNDFSSPPFLEKMKSNVLSRNGIL